MELLKYNLNNFPPIIKNNEEIYIWEMSSKLKERRNLNTITYIETDSIQEIETEINFLKQVLIEGFKEDEINRLIINKECKPSINALKCLLKQQNIDIEKINNIINPLREINSFRNIITHSGREYPDNFKIKTNNLINNLSDSINLLVEVINLNKF